jgi:hypothetical protein
MTVETWIVTQLSCCSRGEYPFHCVTLLSKSSLNPIGSMSFRKSAPVQRRLDDSNDANHVADGSSAAPLLFIKNQLSDCGGQININQPVYRYPGAISGDVLVEELYHFIKDDFENSDCFTENG